MNVGVVALLVTATVLASTATQAGEQERRNGVIDEFAHDPMLFSTALVVGLNAEVTSGTLTSGQFNSLVTNYFLSVNTADGTLAEKITAIYDGSPQARSRLQNAARRIRTARSYAAQADLARRKEEEDLLK